MIGGISYNKKTNELNNYVYLDFENNIVDSHINKDVDDILYFEIKEDVTNMFLKFEDDARASNRVIICTPTKDKITISNFNNYFKVKKIIQDVSFNLDDTTLTLMDSIEELTKQNDALKEEIKNIKAKLGA